MKKLRLITFLVPIISSSSSSLEWLSSKSSFRGAWLLWWWGKSSWLNWLSCWWSKWWWWPQYDNYDDDDEIPVEVETVYGFLERDSAAVYTKTKDEELPNFLWKEVMIPIQPQSLDLPPSIYWYYEIIINCLWVVWVSSTSLHRNEWWQTITIVIIITCICIIII